MYLAGVTHRILIEMQNGTFSLTMQLVHNIANKFFAVVFCLAYFFNFRSFFTVF